MDNQPAAEAKPLTIDERLSKLEKEIEWQKLIHRNIGPDGNMYHYWNILPIIACASGIGVVLGIVVVKVFK